MLKKIIIYLSVPFAAHFSLLAAENTADSLPEQEINFFNRPLARANGKMISLMDVIKRMNVFILERQSQLFNAKGALFQFYSINWADTLEELINNELIIADATEKEITVSDGDVREEMENRFGPNIMANLEKMQLGYEEARKMIQTELIVQRMMWFKVQSKVQQDITPQDVKKAYQEYVTNNPPTEEWSYQMMTIRGEGKEELLDAAKKAHEILMKREGNLEKAIKEFQENYPQMTPSVSEVLVVENKNLSKQHKDVLTTLEIGSFSQPVKQTIRRDNTTVYRLFLLKGHEKKNFPAPFKAMYQELRNSLLNRAAEKEKETYIESLKKRYGMDKEHYENLIPEGYLPFAFN